MPEVSINVIPIGIAGFGFILISLAFFRPIALAIFGVLTGITLMTGGVTWEYIENGTAYVLIYGSTTFAFLGLLFLVTEGWSGNTIAHRTALRWASWAFAVAGVTVIWGPWKNVVLYLLILGVLELICFQRPARRSS